MHDAFDLMAHLERACQAQVAALAGNAELVMPPRGGGAQGRRAVRATRSAGARQCVDGAPAPARPARPVLPRIGAASYTGIDASHRRTRGRSGGDHDVSHRGPRRHRYAVACDRRPSRTGAGQDRQAGQDPGRVRTRRHRRHHGAHRRRQDEREPRPAGHRREQAGRDRPHHGGRGEGRRARRHA